MNESQMDRQVFNFKQMIHVEATLELIRGKHDHKTSWYKETWSHKPRQMHMYAYFLTTKMCILYIHKDVGIWNHIQYI